MTTTAIANATRKNQIARPLKVLVPLIKEEINAGNEAGLEHYQRAGEMLLEAKDQVAHGSWSRWLTKNFELSQSTAKRYMRLARAVADDGHDLKTSGAGRFDGRTIEEVLGEQPRRERHAPWAKIRDIANRVDVEKLTSEHQSREEIIKLRRDLA